MQEFQLARKYRVTQDPVRGCRNPSRLLVAWGQIARVRGFPNERSKTPVKSLEVV